MLVEVKLEKVYVKVKILVGTCHLLRAYWLPSIESNGIRGLPYYTLNNMSIESVLEPFKM